MKDIRRNNAGRQSITAHCPLPTAHFSRSGVSLLEVLISIFVLSIGLLGVAAMIPVGRYEMVEGAKADRSSTLGRAGLRDVKVRRMLEYSQFNPNAPSDTSPVEMWDPTAVVNSVATGTPGYRYVLIDPLYLHQNAPSSAVTSPNDRFPNGYSGGTITMPRVDLRVAPSMTAGWMRTALAEEIFVSHDDLVFDIAKEAGQRPTKVLSTTTSQQQFEGNYSWMVMARYDTTYVSGTTDPTPRATMWVVVFYKRNMQVKTSPDETLNAERKAGIEFIGGGIGGGDTKITLLNKDDVSRLKPNEWLFVAGRRTGGTGVDVGAWYRIVNVAGDPNNNLIQYVTLAGPDWGYTAAEMPAQAVLLGGVVNVFTETVELDRDLLRVAK